MSTGSTDGSAGRFDMNSVRAAVLGAVMTVAAAGMAQAQAATPPLYARTEVRDVRRDHRDVVARRARHAPSDTQANLDRTSSDLHQGRENGRKRANARKDLRASCATEETGSADRTGATSRRDKRDVRHDRRARRPVAHAVTIPDDGVSASVGRRLRPAPEHLRHAPRLRDAAAGRVRSLGVENLADRSEPELAECGDAALRGTAAHRRGRRDAP